VSKGVEEPQRKGKCQGYPLRERGRRRILEAGKEAIKFPILKRGEKKTVVKFLDDWGCNLSRGRNNLKAAKRGRNRGGEIAEKTLIYGVTRRGRGGRKGRARGRQKKL